MRINLVCPFDDRHAAKALGARWDVALRVWYVIDPPDLAPFARWLPLDAAHFLATAGEAPQAKAQPTTRPKKRKGRGHPKASPQPLATQGRQDLGPVDINPAEPPW